MTKWDPSSPFTYLKDAERAIKRLLSPGKRARQSLWEHSATHRPALGRNKLTAGRQRPPLSVSSHPCRATLRAPRTLTQPCRRSQRTTTPRSTTTATHLQRQISASFKPAIKVLDFAIHLTNPPSPLDTSRVTCPLQPTTFSTPSHPHHTRTSPTTAVYPAPSNHPRVRPAARNLRDNLKHPRRYLAASTGSRNTEA